MTFVCQIYLSHPDQYLANAVSQFCGDYLVYKVPLKNKYWQRENFSKVQQLLPINTAWLPKLQDSSPNYRGMCLVCILFT